MMGKTKIEWTEATWNPVTGCTKVSEGCRNCYAERMSKRLAGRCGYPTAPHNFDVTLHPERLKQPLRWKKPRRIFVCSMSDLFHEHISEEFIDYVFAIMALCPQHTFQVLTKRPERMVEYFKDIYWRGDMISDAAAEFNPDYSDEGGFQIDLEEPLSNVWLGVTAENQEAADERIPLLLNTPAAVHFVSLEPLLGPIDLIHGKNNTYDLLDGMDYERLDNWGANPSRIDWVIVGGESGPGARPMHPDWVYSLRDQCIGADIPFFFKQWGEYRTGNTLPYLDVEQAIQTGYTEQESFNLMFGNNPYGLNREYYELKKVILDDIEFFKVGKKQAGRLLDGREWNEYPKGGSDV